MDLWFENETKELQTTEDWLKSRENPPKTEENIGKRVKNGKLQLDFVEDDEFLREIRGFSEEEIEKINYLTLPKPTKREKWKGGVGWLPKKVLEILEKFPIEGPRKVVYILRLRDECWYVGYTTHFANR